MFEWLLTNLATIAVTLVIIAIVTAIVVYMYREKKKGHCSCGGNCAACSACHHGGEDGTK